LLEHLGDLVLHAEPDTLEVDGDRAVPVFLGAVSRWSVRPRNTSVVMRIIQSAIGLDNLLNQRSNLGCFRDIGRHKKSISTGLFDYPYGLLAPLDKDVGNDSFRAFPGKRQCACPAYSRSGTRHQSHFAFELLGHFATPYSAPLIRLPDVRLGLRFVMNRYNVALTGAPNCKRSAAFGRPVQRVVGPRHAL